MNRANITFVLGGARSGKSAFAEDHVASCGLDKIYIATADAWDDEMRERIALHRARRGPEWQTVDAPLNLVDALKANARNTANILIDCLTLWLTNLLMAERDPDVATHELTEFLETRAGPVTLVSNEVGLGIVPENALARQFRDAQGRLNQRIAAIADDVYFIAAGLPLALKTSSPT